MNAFQVKPPKELTVKTLREYLDAMDALWDEEDKEYMGEFENQKINVPYFKDDGAPKGYERFAGYGEGCIHYDGGLDFIVQQKEEDFK